MTKSKMILSIVVAFGLITIFLSGLSHIKATEEQYGGSYEACVEMGEEPEMCKKVFEW